jgi:hypothetical protein
MGSWGLSRGCGYLSGQVQRHFYVTRPARWLRRWQPDAIFVELEPFSVRRCSGD